jgi:molybdopterin molybdotransferase
MDMDWSLQRIARLTPLDDVLARIDAVVKPVSPCDVAVRDAIGRIVASDVPLPLRPAAAMAWRDGWAVSADAATDASSYNPLALPGAGRVDSGAPLPAGTDAVAGDDSVIPRNGGAAIIAPVAPGEGVLLTGADLDGNSVLPGGRRLTAIQAAVLAAAGIDRIAVRMPRLRVVTAREGDDSVLDSVATLVAAGVAAGGGAVEAPRATAIDLATALTAPDVDAVVVIGGTGSGRRDQSIAALARAGAVDVHGIALSPGETAALGHAGAGGCPVLILPGRLDAALAVWLTVGRCMLARLTGDREVVPGRDARLIRKVASPLGMAEMIPVRCRDGGAEPLASGTWPWQVMAEADGWILVTAGSEGAPAGAPVVVGSWP